MYTVIFNATKGESLTGFGKEFIVYIQKSKL